ncbi:uncharacterized protein N0V89_007392 [Didymosphaeria variabile]|uniref:Zn(2)-C6 fungal-type domain-containing protein n=1 Tax=Didymosphaeria variabile TaxID=1932322 RepID=A0A9W9CAR8_9PLEO|nr:uncharacterized protein N0V89_007392 [Didymosphaeria variabile]KAJ4352046.1 hypothetical protein N0V89_007392 [Didymosphaeria variabile]
MNPKATRQCWECLKRRLVCDYTLPHCKKCIKKGRECPGYDARKPLQWVEPGKVTSRKPKKPSKKSELVLRVCQSRPPMEESKSDTSWSIETIRSEEEATVDEEELRNLYQKKLADVRTVEDIDEIIHFASQDRIEEIVSKRLDQEAARILKMEKDPLKGLERVLRYLRLEQIPTYNLQSDTCEVVQAINYCMLNPRPHYTKPLVCPYQVVPWANLQKRSMRTYGLGIVPFLYGLICSQSTRA